MALSDRICISLSRALLSGADLLLIGSSLDQLGESSATRLILLLREWVQKRGLSVLSADNKPGLQLYMKPKKTVIFSTSSQHLVPDADAVISLQP